MSITRLTLAAATAAFLLAAAARAQITSTNSISLQAKLDGVMSGPVNLTVQFYDAASDGNAVGAPIALDGVAVQDGVVSVPVSPVDPTVFDGSTRYMGISVNGGDELSPRTLVTSVPYAARTLNLRSDVLGRFGIGQISTGLLAPLHIRTGGFETWQNGEQGHIRLEGGDDAFWSKLTFGREGTSNATAAIGVASYSFGSVMSFGTSNSYAAGVTNQALQIDHLGRVVVGGGSASSADTFHVNGQARVAVLTITGGSDLAEPFPVSPSEHQPAEPLPGMVMSIDPENPGMLRVSNQAYDTRVAGVYSGGNGLPTGMVMGKQGCDLTSAGEGRLPLAMTGRVWVFVDESAGKIEPGDRLTTSGEKPGHAMKVSDASRAPGAVIGKAMTPRHEKTGMALLLVNLQ